MKLQIAWTKHGRLNEVLCEEWIVEDDLEGRGEVVVVEDKLSTTRRDHLKNIMEREAVPNWHVPALSALLQTPGLSDRVFIHLVSCKHGKPYSYH
eukprot:4683119-Amphidinium_carterae.2